MRAPWKVILGVVASGLALGAGPARPTPAGARPPGGTRSLRVNDTLRLEVSRPVATFATPDHEAATTLWQRAELRGSRGYRQIISLPRTLCTLYGTRASPSGELLRLAFWRDLDQQLPQGRAHPRRPLELAHEDAFACPVWDVRYRTWSWFCDAGLQPLVPHGDDVFGFQGSAYGFTGGSYELGTYHLPPTWLTQEQARVQRTHRLPPAPRLQAFLALSDDSAGYLLKPPYRPLLAQLLRAYAACPQPPATARRLALARRRLARTPPR